MENKDSLLGFITHGALIQQGGATNSYTEAVNYCIEATSSYVGPRLMRKLTCDLYIIIFVLSIVNCGLSVVICVLEATS